MNILPALTGLAVFAAWTAAAWAIGTRLGTIMAGPISDGRCPQCSRTIEDCRCTPHGPRGGGR